MNNYLNSFFAVYKIVTTWFLLSKCDFYVGLMRNWIWWYDLFKPLFSKVCRESRVCICVLSFWLIMECFKAWQHLWSRLCYQTYAKSNSKRGFCINDNKYSGQLVTSNHFKMCLVIEVKILFHFIQYKFQWTLPISLKAKISHKSCYIQLTE